MERLHYHRQLPVEEGFDVIVVGGGPSGVAAAIAAGRMGRKVALIEQTGCLGGIGTSGLVTVLMPFADGQRTLMHGIGLEFVQALHARGFLPPSVSPDLWQQGLRRAVPFNGEGLKFLMDEWVEKAGFVACRSFDDEIGRYNYSIDIHRSSPSVEDYEQLIEEFTRGYRLADGQSYGIPYRSLILKEAVNLLVAGRCISADRMVQGSIRVMPCCFITGQAAGAAVALCCEQDVATVELDPALLQSALRSQGAYIL